MGDLKEQEEETGSADPVVETPVEQTELTSVSKIKDVKSVQELVEVADADVSFERKAYLVGLVRQIKAQIAEKEKELAELNSRLAQVMSEVI